MSSYFSLKMKIYYEHLLRPNDDDVGKITHYSLCRSPLPTANYAWLVRAMLVVASGFAESVTHLREQLIRKEESLAYSPGGVF
jgi:hypothetical protein